jgi:pyruvate/2-oxoglutarate/acetoin dehydrogenase E1 component
MEVKAMKSFYYAQLEGIQAEMRKDKNMFFFYEYQKPVAAASGKPIINLEQEFGRLRVNYSGLDEMWYIGAVLGAGMTGQRAIGHIPTMTPLVPFELIAWHAGRLRHMTGGQATFPVMLIIQESNMGPGSGGQHSCYGEEKYYAGTPGIKVVVPSTPYDAKGLAISALRDPDPVVYIDTRGLPTIGPDAPDEDYTVPIGKASLISEGRDITIVGFGLIMDQMYKALKRLTAEGVSAEVIDLRTINPLDDEAVIKSVRKTGKLLCAESGYYTLGVMAEVVARTAEAVPGTKIKRIAFPDAPQPGSPEMMNWMKVDAEKIYNAAKKLL